MPREQREALLDEFERGGLTATRFARAAGINYQTIACWVQRRRHDRREYSQPPPAASAALRLLEVVAEAVPDVLPSAQPARASTTALELLLPGGARLLLHDASQAELAARLLRHLDTSSASPAC